VRSDAFDESGQLRRGADALGEPIGGGSATQPGSPPHAASSTPLSVTELNRRVSLIIEQGLPWVHVAGEISNFTRAASGHWYFTLKDGGAQVRAVMFRNRNQAAGFVPREGMQVEVKASASLYEPRGDFQLGVEAIRRAGQGDLYQRFLQLKARLEREGLFDAQRKRALPAMPRCVGIVTSRQAAALREVLATLRRRAPHVPVILYPAPVQGAQAASAIRTALQCAASRAECDVLLLVRGGGSIEDLWSFNDEALAREIAASPIPVVSGVGHETDFTIADFVADWRAATPTAAAVAAVPDRAELLARLASSARAMARSVARRLARDEQQLDSMLRALRPPSAQWRERGVRLAHLGERLQMIGRRLQQQRLQRLQAVSHRLAPPSVALEFQRLGALVDRLGQAQARRIERADAQVTQTATRLELASPGRLLERGYAIVLDARGQVVRKAAEVAPDGDLRVMLGAGAIDVRVTRVRPDSIVQGPADGFITPASDLS